MRDRSWTCALGVAVAIALAAGCGSSSTTRRSGGPTTTTSSAPIVWPAPSDPMALAKKAGLVPETAERLQFHVHAHLDVFVDGRKVTVPAGLGIDIDNPRVHSFPNDDGATGYGGIVVPCGAPCISPLHTHDVSGILHTESATRKYNTLGQLFTEWNVKLDENCVNTFCTSKTKIAIYVDGKPVTTDPRTIALTNLEEIAVVIGTPPANIPSVGDFSAL